MGKKKKPKQGTLAKVSQQTSQPVIQQTSQSMAPQPFHELSVIFNLQIQLQEAKRERENYRTLWEKSILQNNLAVDELKKKIEERDKQIDELKKIKERDEEIKKRDEEIKERDEEIKERDELNDSLKATLAKLNNQFDRLQHKQLMGSVAFKYLYRLIEVIFGKKFKELRNRFHSIDDIQDYLNNYGETEEKNRFKELSKGWSDSLRDSLRKLINDRNPLAHPTTEIDEDDIPEPRRLVEISQSLYNNKKSANLRADIEFIITHLDILPQQLSRDLLE